MTFQNILLTVKGGIARLTRNRPDQLNCFTVNPVPQSEAARPKLAEVSYAGPRVPLAWADAIGIGYLVTVLHHLATSYGEGRYCVSPLLRRKLAVGVSFHG